MVEGLENLLLISESNTSKNGDAFPVPLFKVTIGTQPKMSFKLILTTTKLKRINKLSLMLHALFKSFSDVDESQCAYGLQEFMPSVRIRVKLQLKIFYKFELPYF
jgi:hypothetical protein